MSRGVVKQEENQHPQCPSGAPSAGTPDGHYGHGRQVGDAVLVTVADALSKDGPTVGRYGGDEFVAVLLGADRDAAQRYRDSVLDSLAHAGLTDPETGARVPVVVSIGLVVYPTEAARIEELIKLADSEMYAVKRQRPVGSTGRSLPQALGSERAARTVGELLPLLTSHDDVDEKLRLAAHRLSIGAGCDAVNFSMFPPEPGGATVSQSFGRLPAEFVEAWDDDVRAEWEVPHPLRLLVERTRRPVIIEDLENNDRIPARQRELLSAAGLRSGLVVPLLLQDTAVGLLAVGSRREAAFGPNGPSSSWPLPPRSPVSRAWRRWSTSFAPRQTALPKRGSRRCCYSPPPPRPTTRRRAFTSNVSAPSPKRWHASSATAKKTQGI